MVLPRLAAALALSCAACASPEPPSTTPSTRTDPMEQAAVRGRQFATRACASCHAVGAVGQSPLPAAPPFPEILQRRPLDQLEAAFAEGMVTGHPAMPDHLFRASEIDDLIAYLETVKAGP